MDNDKVYSFKPDQIQEGIDFLLTATKLIGHNIIGFDIPVIEKLYGVDLSTNCAVMDTLVLSRLFNPTREGSHSLAAWGYRLGQRKMDFKEFEEYTEEMLTYCINDVLVNAKLYNHLKVESKGFSKQSVDIEHAMAKYLHKQREHGFMLNEEGSTILLAELSEKLEDTKAARL